MILLNPVTKFLGLGVPWGYDCYRHRYPHLARGDIAGIPAAALGVMG